MFFLFIFQDIHKIIIEKTIKTSLKSKDLNLNTGQAFLCSWIERSTTVRMAILPELIYKFNAIKTLFSQNLYRIKSK